MSGWISLHRQIKEHWIWEESDYLKWWIDILLRVNHKDVTGMFNKKPRTYKRGTFHTSTVKLAEQWNVSRNTVNRFLKLLEQDNMIKIISSNDGTTIEVLNYNVYQGFSEEKRQPTEQRSEQRTEQQIEQRTEHRTEQQTDIELNTNNNDNNELIMKNNENNNNNSVGVDYNNQDFSIIVNEWQKLGFGMITERSTEQILDWLKVHDKDLIMHVIQYAHDNGAINQRYVQAVLKSAREKNVKTVADFEAEQQKRAASRRTVNGKPNNQVIQPKWFKEQKETEPSKEVPKETDTDISNMINQFRKGQTP